MADEFNCWECDDFDGLTCDQFDVLACGDCGIGDVVIPIAGTKEDHEACITVAANRNNPQFIHGSELRPPGPDIEDEISNFNNRLGNRLNRPRRYTGDTDS